MGKKTLEAEDTWFGVHDAKKRKKIQDRLAQRARRERLAQRKRSSHSPTDAPQNYSLPLIRMKPVTSHFPRPNPSPVHSISLDHALLPLPNLTIYSAMFHNGVILGLACGSSSVSISKPALPHVPEPLRPTTIQLENVHFEWIDRFPMAEFRDKMITCADTFSIEGFLAELFTSATFLLTPGRASWDPDAWHPTEEFKKKRSYLF